MWGAQVERERQEFQHEDEVNMDHMIPTSSWGFGKVEFYYVGCLEGKVKLCKTEVKIGSHFP